MAVAAPGPPGDPAGATAAPGGRARGRRARLDPETRRAQLIDVASDQLDATGSGGFSVDDVADAAGVSRSLVYAYFGDRNGLVAEVYVRVLDRLDRELGLDLPPDEAAVRRIVGACMSFAARNRSAWRMLVSDQARQHPMVQAARVERAIRISAHWSGAPGVCDDPGSVPAVAATPGAAADPAADVELAGAQLAAEAALGLLESGVLHWLDHPELAAEQASALLTGLLWSGLTGPPATD